jgi:hypothetical protein
MKHGWRTALDDVVGDLRECMGDQAYSASKFDRAGELLKELSSGEFQEFLTTMAYRDLA